MACVSPAYTAQNSLHIGSVYCIYNKKTKTDVRLKLKHNNNNNGNDYDDDDDDNNNNNNLSGSSGHQKLSKISRE